MTEHTNVEWQYSPAYVHAHTSLYSIISTDNADLVVGAELSPYTEHKTHKVQVGTKHVIERVPNKDTVQRYKELAAEQKAKGIVGPTGLFLDDSNSHDEIVEVPVYESTVETVYSDKRRGKPIQVGDTVQINGRVGVLESLNPLIINGAVYRWNTGMVVSRVVL